MPPRRRARYEQRNTMWIDATDLAELRRIAKEQDRSLSKVVRMCIEIGLKTVRKMPSVEKTP